MKIWEVIRDGKDREVYKASNTVLSWEGVEIQVQKTISEQTIVVFAVIPAIRASWIGLGRVIPLCRAVTEADWEFVEIRDPANYSKSID